MMMEKPSGNIEPATTTTATATTATIVAPPSLHVSTSGARPPTSGEHNADEQPASASSTSAGHRQLSAGSNGTTTPSGHASSAAQHWDGARTYVNSKMLPRNQHVGGASGNAALAPRQSVMVMSSLPPSSAVDANAVAHATSAGSNAAGDALHSVVAKRSFHVKHAAALREQMESSGRSTEKVNLFTKSGVLKTVRTSWIAHAEGLDRMYISREEDMQEDENDGAREHTRCLSRKTQDTFDAWDLILTSRSNVLAIDGEQATTNQRDTDFREQMEAAEINKLSSLRIRTRRSAGDDNDLIREAIQGDYAAAHVRLREAKSAVPSSRSAIVQPGAHQNGNSAGSYEKIQLSKSKLQIYDRLASVRNKRILLRDPKHRYSSSRQDGVSMYIEQHRRAQTAPMMMSRSRAYELHNGITTLNPSLTPEQQDAQSQELHEYQRHVLDVRKTSSQQRASAALAYGSGKFGGKKPVLLSAYDFRMGSFKSLDSSTAPTTRGTRDASSSSSTSFHGHDDEVHERLSPWLRRYSTVAWRDKTLGFSGKVWDVAFSKYQEETLQREFDRMARHWKEGSICFSERSISLFHAGLVKNYIIAKRNIAVVQVINCRLSDTVGVPFLKALQNTVTVLKLVGNRLGERSLKVISEMLLVSSSSSSTCQSIAKLSSSCPSGAEHASSSSHHGRHRQGRKVDGEGHTGVLLVDGIACEELAGSDSLVQRDDIADDAHAEANVPPASALHKIANANKRSSSVSSSSSSSSAVPGETHHASATSASLTPTCLIPSVADGDLRRHLVELDLSGNDVPSRTWSGATFHGVLDAMQTNRSVRHLKLSGCSFSWRVVGTLAEMLKRNRFLKSLNLSGNHFDTASCGRKFGEGIKVNKSLEMLDLSSCSITDESAQSIFASLSDLFESQLKELRLGNNPIGKMACYAARYSLKRNSYLEVLGLEGTQLGYYGVVQLFSAMAYSETLQLVKMDNVNFTPQQSRVESDFDPTNPVGEYRLRLEQPGQRSIAVQLVGVWKKQGRHVWQHAQLDGKSFELTEAMGWPDAMPEVGVLTLDVIPPHERIRTTEQLSNAKAAIDDAVLDKLYFTPHILDQSPMWKAQYLKAMAMGFFYECRQVARVLKSLIGHGETSQIASLVGCFFPRVIDIENIGEISDVIEAELWEEVQAKMGILGTFNEASPNGRYNLDLSLFEHRYFCLKLQELERKELDDLMAVPVAMAPSSISADGGPARQEGYAAAVDPRSGSGSIGMGSGSSSSGSVGVAGGKQSVVCVRNIVYDGTRLDRLKLYEWPVPKKGIVQLDYSTTKRSLHSVATDMTVSLVEFLLEDLNVTEHEVLERIYEFHSLTRSNAIISLMQSTKASDSAREEHLLKFMNDVKASRHRKGKRRSRKAEDMSSVRLRILHILKVVTSKFSVTAKQTYEIISMELTRSFVVDCVVTLFPAIRDISQKNIAMIASAMTVDEQIELGSRLGVEKYSKYAPGMHYRIDIENPLELESFEHFTKLAYFSDNKTNFFDICIGGKKIKAPEDGSLYSYLISRTKLYREPNGRPGQILFRLDVGNHDRRLRAAEKIQNWFAAQKRLRHV